MSNEKDIAQRKNVIKEIIESEVTYNNGLQMMDVLVKEPLLKKINDGEISPSIDMQIPQLFEKISQIRLISDTLNQELYQFISNQTTIGQAFKTFPKLIIIYCDYIRLFHSTNPILIRTREENKSLDNFFKTIEPKLCNTIQSFLITPVQRPPRYRLLLNQLLSTFPQHKNESNSTSKNPDLKKEEEEDYNLLKIAYDTTCDEISKIDEAIDVFDEACRMGQIQAKFKDLDVFTLHRRLFFDGESMKFSRKKVEMRYLIVFSDFLIVAENTILPSTTSTEQPSSPNITEGSVKWKKMGNSLKVNKKYPTGEYLIVNVEDNGIFLNAVDVLQKEKSFRVNMENSKAKQSILQAFQKVKDMSLEKFTNKTDEYAPVWVPDSLVPNCMICDSAFSFFNRKHHCRKCGACICKKCFKKIIIPNRDPEPLGVCTKCFDKISATEKCSVANDNNDTNDSIPSLF